MMPKLGIEPKRRADVINATITCIEAFKAFMTYYGLKIESEIAQTMTPGEMIDVTLKYILPPYQDDT